MSLIDATAIVRITVDNAARSSAYFMVEPGWVEETPPDPPELIGGLQIAWQ